MQSWCETEVCGIGFGGGGGSGSSGVLENGATGWNEQGRCYKWCVEVERVWGS